MAYKITKANEAYRYEAPGHFDVLTTRLHNAADVDAEITLGLSHFLPGGGAKMATSVAEMMYYVVEGEMTITTGNDGIAHVLKKGDSIHFNVGQDRECKNTGIVVAQMLVVMGSPKK